MEIFIKLASRHYDVLRDRTPVDSPAHRAIGQATPIEHALGGVEFEGLYHSVRRNPGADPSRRRATILSGNHSRYPESDQARVRRADPLS